MCRPWHWLLGVALVGTTAGCQSTDLVEAELRTQENRVHQLHAELERAEAFNAALERELVALRSTSAAKVTPERAAQTYTVQEIVLGRQTGGYDDDNVPGDEALQVVLEPRDPDGHDLKAPGWLHVTALQITPQGLKAPLSSWDVNPDQLRRTWRNGLFGTGYYVVLPWKVVPTSCRLRVVAQFRLADGRLFEADRDVTVHPPPAAIPPGLPLAPSVSPSPVPDDPDALPPPRRVEPGPTIDPPSGGPVRPGGMTPAALWQRGAVAGIGRPVPFTGAAAP